MPFQKAVNELNVVAKFILATLKNQDANDDPTQVVWKALTPVPKIYGEITPEGKNVSNGVVFGMFKNVHSVDYKGAYGQRLNLSGIWEITAVVSGTDFTPLHLPASAIDYTFDWQNQEDPAAGRSRCQEIFVDPDDSSVELVIMACSRIRAVRYPIFAESEGKNYCHLGGEYFIDCYREPS